MDKFDCLILVQVPTLVNAKLWDDLEKLGNKYNLEWGVIQNEEVLDKIEW